MNRYYRIAKRNVVHIHTGCRHYQLAERIRKPIIIITGKKPRNCTVCDECQRLNQRDKKAATR